MAAFLDTHQIEVGEKAYIPFLQSNGIYQDGTTPMYRDVDGTLWAMSGHSHIGHIGMFRGASVDDLKEVYPIQTNFCVGHADYAFSGIRYPEGIKPRGSIWPFGLYICPGTHRFFCFFHNETGWAGKGTAYDALGLCDKPHFDSDFRHIGLMHSDDEGQNWTFDRWVLTAEHVCFTDRYNPGAGLAKGQPIGDIGLGSGDFSLFVDPNGDYMYLFYNIIKQNPLKGEWNSCDIYVARSRKRDDGIMGDFVKYYDGAFCEAGNFGKESVIIENGWHPRVVYCAKYDTHLISYNPLVGKVLGDGLLEGVLTVREGKDLVHWSEPIKVYKDGEKFGNHYVAMVADDTTSHPAVIAGDTFAILTNHNGTDVDHHKAKFVEK